jgi:hypothetical protein
MHARLPTIVAIMFLVASAAIVGLNLVVDRSSFWAIWVIWALGMTAAAVIGIARFSPHRLLGFWLGFGSVLLAGLFLIDLWDESRWWFFWPLGAWVVGLMAIAGLTINLLDSVPTSRPMVEVVDDTPVEPGSSSSSSAATTSSQHPARSVRSDSGDAGTLPA